ncbi:MAG TPA: HAMP domain-containing sensor histidine kinase, partial [Vicinamibacteria bacterium]|nr:HAMP domain-containing sensor histidine kinase [Vicinamibacteria bacterium]
PVSWPNRFDSIIEPPTRHLEARDEAGATFRDEIPALVLPWLSERPEAVGGEGGEGGGAPDGHVIIELDHDYIVEEFLPSLAERHLSIGDGVTYQALIVRRTDPPEIVYQTADGLSLQDFSTPDESRYLFDLLSERQYRELLLNVGLSLGMLIPESPEAHEDFAAAQVPASVLSEGESDFGRWQILVRHPAGSLQQAFDQRRRRGIAVNLGLFGLLGAMAVLLVVSTQRAQRLASQQLDIVAGVSHELRTPLSVIRMAAGNLERGAVRNEESVKRYAALIGSEERRLSEMVERALAFGQMQSRDQCFDRELVSVAQIIEAAVGDCRPLIERHQARIERDNTPGDLQVRGDAQALRHAVQNLVANAIKHSGPSPCVRIQARRSESGEAGEVTIRVADEGRGISPEDLPRIFEPFFRGRRTGNGPVEGTGLGLTLVEEIVEAHEGRVTVESDRSGSVFTIRLPDRGSS